jgi:porphobilinogen deaminase
MANKKTTVSEKSETVSINVDLPIELHKQLRIRAITENLRLRDAIVAAVECWLLHS